MSQKNSKPKDTNELLIKNYQVLLDNYIFAAKMVQRVCKHG